MTEFHCYFRLNSQSRVQVAVLPLGMIDLQGTGFWVNEDFQVVYLPDPNAKYWIPLTNIEYVERIEVEESANA